MERLEPEGRTPLIGEGSTGAEGRTEGLSVSGQIDLAELQHPPRARKIIDHDGELDSQPRSEGIS